MQIFFSDFKAIGLTQHPCWRGFKPRQRRVKCSVSPANCVSPKLFSFRFLSYSSGIGNDVCPARETEKFREMLHFYNIWGSGGCWGRTHSPCGFIGVFCTILGYKKNNLAKSVTFCSSESGFTGLEDWQDCCVFWVL